MITLRWMGDEEFAPTKGPYEGDVGIDLYVAGEHMVPYRGFVDVPCGVSIELPEGVWGMLVGRSSTIRKRGLLVNQGIIDTGYRGPLFAAVQNVGKGAAVIREGERIAQLLLFPMITDLVTIRRVTSLSESERGAAAFGSTGV